VLEVGAVALSIFRQAGVKDLQTLNPLKELLFLNLERFRG